MAQNVNTEQLQRYIP